MKRKRQSQQEGTTVSSSQATPTFGCRWCGISKQTHSWQSSEQVGRHEWVMPTSVQMKERASAQWPAGGAR